MISVIAMKKNVKSHHNAYAWTRNGRFICTDSRLQMRHPLLYLGDTTTVESIETCWFAARKVKVFIFTELIELAFHVCYLGLTTTFNLSFNRAKILCSPYCYKSHTNHWAEMADKCNQNIEMFTMYKMRLYFFNSRFPVF